jgi:hypothetical protein
MPSSLAGALRGPRALFFAFAFALSLAALPGCESGPDAAAMQADVEAALQAKDYAGAVAKADEALKVEAISKEPAKAWRFESLRLQGLAEGGKGAEVVAGLERLTGAYPTQINPALYRALADKLRAAGDGPGAVSVLDAGKKKYPDDPSFQAAIDELAKTGDPAEIEALKALGYLGD